MILLWQNHRLPRRGLLHRTDGTFMRVALLGAGTIARLVLTQLQRGALSGVEVCGLLGRPGSARAHALASEFGVAAFDERAALLKSARPQALLEAASHD